MRNYVKNRLKCAGLGPKHVKLTQLLSGGHVLDSVRALRVGGGSFGGLFEFDQDGRFTILDELYGEDAPDYPHGEVHSLVTEIFRAREPVSGSTAAGRLIVGHPVWLYHKGRAYLKGCFVAIPPVPAQANPNAIRQVAAFAADLYSERISSAFGFLAECSKCKEIGRDVRLETHQLASVMDNIGAGLVLVNQDMHVAWHNSIVTGKQGSTSLVGRSCHEALYGRDDECHGCMISRTFESGHSQTGRFSAELPDSEIRHFKMTTMPVYNDQGAPSQVLALVYDVTDARMAEFELAKYKRLVNYSNDLMMVTDEYGSIVAVNTRLTSELGYSEQELIGRVGSSLAPADEFDKGTALGENARFLGMAMDHIHLVGKDGRVIPTQVFVTYDKEYNVFEVVFRDVSERLRMEQEIRNRSEQLQAQNEEVRAAMDEKTQFFRNVSHELRTPITSVIGFSELLLEDDEDRLTDRQKRALERIKGNAYRLLGLVNDLLDLSKLEAQRTRVETAEVSLRDFLDQVISNMMPLAQDKGLSLDLEVQDDLLCLTTDERKLGHILVNLIANAIKFTRQGGVTVTAAKNGKSIVIAVRDTGIGIPEEELQHIFREFHQVPGQASALRGTGLGLTIARKLAALLGGEITVQSQVGVGSTFTLDIPLIASG